MLRMKLGVGLGWGGVRMITFFAFAHMVGPTQDHVSCTCTHGWCYATSCFLHSDDEQAWPEPLSPLSRDIERGRRQLLESEVCKERRDSYVLTAGDNCAESLCAVSKKQLRRTNLNIAVVRAPLPFEFTLVKQSSRLGAHHASTAVPQNEMHVLVSPTDAFKKPLWQL